MARESGELLWQQPVGDGATELEVALIYAEDEGIAHAQAVKLVDKLLRLIDRLNMKCNMIGTCIDKRFGMIYRNIR